MKAQDTERAGLKEVVEEIFGTQTFKATSGALWAKTSLASVRCTLGEVDGEKAIVLKFTPHDGGAASRVLLSIAGAEVVCALLSLTLATTEEHP